MLGPTAEDLEDRTATGTSEAGWTSCWARAEANAPPARGGSHCELRRPAAAIDAGDYLIEADGEQRYLLVGGIRSTGPTSSMAIAEHVRDLLADVGLS